MWGQQVHIHRGLGDAGGLGSLVRRLSGLTSPWGELSRELRLLLSSRFLTASMGLGLSGLWRRRGLPCKVPIPHHSGCMIRISDGHGGTLAQCKHDAPRPTLEDTHVLRQHLLDGLELPTQFTLPVGVAGAQVQL